MTSWVIDEFDQRGGFGGVKIQQTDIDAVMDGIAPESILVGDEVRLKRLTLTVISRIWYAPSEPTRLRIFLSSRPGHWR
jgi:hypothetical protein